MVHGKLRHESAGISVSVSVSVSISVSIRVDKPRGVIAIRARVQCVVSTPQDYSRSPLLHIVKFQIHYLNRSNGVQYVLRPNIYLPSVYQLLLGRYGSMHNDLYSTIDKSKYGAPET